MRYTTGLLGLWGLILLFVSCDKAEPIPSYIYVPDIKVATNSSQGSKSDNITDVWLYVNDNLQGIYQLPAWIPILEEGPTKLNFYGGIKLNGISNTRAAYPMYNSDEQIVDLQPTETDTITPELHYLNACQFKFIEDFENGNEFDNVVATADPSLVFEGAKSGQVLDTARTFRIKLKSSYNIPNPGVYAFVELDYKSSHTMSAGFIAGTSSGNVTVTKVAITPKSEWSKIYLNFTPEVKQLQAQTMQLFFDVDASDDSDPIEIYLDNVKIVYL